MNAKERSQMLFSGQRDSVKGPDPLEHHHPLALQLQAQVHASSEQHMKELMSA